MPVLHAHLRQFSNIRRPLQGEEQGLSPKKRGVQRAMKCCKRQVEEISALSVTLESSLSVKAWLKARGWGAKGQGGRSGSHRHLSEVGGVSSDLRGNLGIARLFLRCTQNFIPCTTKL